ncbi:septum formation initiator family protein [bacterium]|nr:septum formation initiator family protein [bacterium]
MALSDRIRDVFVRFKRVVLFASGVAIIVWFVFFDSYSLMMRIQLHREKSQLEKANSTLREEISRLDDKVSRRLSDDEVERIAREDYHMSKEGETVYPVVPK